MTRLQKKNIKLKNKAFTLSEAIFSIFISILVILILQNVLINLKTANKASHRTDDIVFMYVQFNRFLREDTDLVYVLPESSNSSRVRFIKREGSGKNKLEKTYIIEKYKNMIRTTTGSGGHMPLLLDVKGATFSAKDEQIKMNIEEKDGRKSELYFKLDPKPKEEKKKDEKLTAKEDKNVKSKRASK